MYNITYTYICCYLHNGMSERMNIYRRDGQAISCINKRLQENVHNERNDPKLSIPLRQYMLLTSKKSELSK